MRHIHTTSSSSCEARGASGKLQVHPYPVACVYCTINMYGMYSSMLVDYCTVVRFRYHFFTFQLNSVGGFTPQRSLLDKPWLQVSSLLAPPPSFLSCIGFSILVHRMLEIADRTFSIQLGQIRYKRQIGSRKTYFSIRSASQTYSPHLDRKSADGDSLQPGLLRSGEHPLIDLGENYDTI